MKRPLIPIVLYYILGIFMTKYYIYNSILMVISLIIIILSILIIFNHYKKTFIFWFLFMYVLGSINMYIQIQPKDLRLENEILHKKEVEIEGKVKDIVAVYEDTVKIKLRSSMILLKNKYKSNKSQDILCYVRDYTNPQIGDKIVIKGELEQFESPRNPGVFNELYYYKSRRYNYKCYGKLKDIVVRNNFNILNYFYTLRNSIGNLYNELLPQEEASIMKAMILGDKDDLSNEIKTLYQETGIAHILAISGLHITILTLFIYKLLCFIKIPNKINSIITIAILIMYCLFTGGSISTVRAVLMSSIVLFAQFIDREPDIVSSISLSALFILLYSPYNLWDVGFQLSFSAVIGIISITPIMDRIYIIPEKMRQIIGVSIAASLSIYPITAYHFYQISTLSMITNLIVVPLLFLVVVGGIFGLIISSLSLLMGKFLIGIVYYVLLFYKILATFISKIPFSILLTGRPSTGIIIIFYILIIMMILKFQIKKTKKIYTYISLAVIIVFGLQECVNLYLDKDAMEIVFLDVDQGDSAIIHTSDNKNIIIDGGGIYNKDKTKKNTGGKIIYPYLKSKRINKIHGMFISHPNSDHILGLLELIDYVKIEYIFISDVEYYENDLYNELIKKAKNNKIPVKRIHSANNIKIGDLEISCLLPDQNYTYNDLNNASNVLSIRYNKFSILFTGDMERELENLFVQQYQSDFFALKVPHHGSNSSSTIEFLDVIDPKLAIISSGRENRFGHPHPEVIKRLKDRGIKIYNTSKDGAIILKTNGNKVNIKTMIKH